MKILTFACILGLILLIVIYWQLQSAAVAIASDRWGLWQNSPHLCGINIHQHRSYSDVDGNLANVGPVIPPYSQADLDKLAAMGVRVELLQKYHTQADFLTLFIAFFNSF